MAAVEVVALELRHGGGRAEHEERRGGGHEGVDDVVGLGDDRAPLVVPRGDQGRGDDATSSGVERGEADDVVADDHERRHGIDALDHHRARAGAAIDEVDVDPAPAEREVQQEPASVGGEREVGPRGLVREVTEDQLVAVPVRTEPVPVGLAPVALVLGWQRRRFGVAGVGEPGAVRQPRDRAGPGVGDGVAAVLAGLDVDDAQRAALIAAGRDAVREEPPVGARPEPVDGCGGIAGQDVGVDDGAGGAGFQRRAHHQHALIVGSPPFE